MSTSLAISDGRRWVENFQNVSEFYSNIAKMLLSADGLLRERQIFPYRWASVYPQSKLEDFLEWPQWVPELVVRQYYPSGRKDEEVITLGAVPWLTEYAEYVQPLCIMSRIVGNTFKGEDIYWISVSQAYSPDVKADGEVKIITLDNLDTLDEEEVTEFKKIVKGEKFLSIAVPLLDITDSMALKNRLITPLLNDQRWKTLFA